MELLFNVKQKNVVAKIGEDYFFLSKKPKKLEFADSVHKTLVLKHCLYCFLYLLADEVLLVLLLYYDWQ